MKFGICCSADAARDMASAGFDYAEVGAHDLHANVAKLSGLPIEATNLFFPGEFRLFTPVIGDYLNHAHEAIHAANSLGVKVMVIGSGNQRKSPPEVSREDSLSWFVSVVGHIQEVASKYKIAIAPESLNRSETNVGNDLRELAVALQSRGIGYTADSFHVLREAQSNAIPINWEQEIPFAPKHVHFANLPRHLPDWDDPSILGFFRRLRELGYDSRISFEGDLQHHSPTEAVERLRQLWHKP